MQNSNKYDAIVIGAGMSGGWSAKELCERGLKTLLVERGRDVKHIKDYPTTNLKPWEFEYRGEISRAEKEANPSIARCYAYREDNKHFFVKDMEHPYIQDEEFDWIRGYQVGGKSLMWARQTQRWSDFDFEGPLRDGFAVDWPIRYKDLAPWYSYVEKFAGISGNKDGLDTLPDGEFLPALDLNCVEKHFQSSLKRNYSDRHLIYGRCAHITEQREIFRQQGRGLCLNRTECERGCPFGGYFNANSTTIPWAAKTGNLTLRPNAILLSIIYSDKENKAIGVRVIDSESKEITEYFAKLIFLNAGALNTLLIMLNSTSERFPNGIGNDNGALGKYVAFHNYRSRINAICEDFGDRKSVGKRPTSGYIPRFRNVYRQETGFLRGYAAGFSAARYSQRTKDGIGQELKEHLFAPSELGPWVVNSHMMGETVPKATNRVYLDPQKTDEWGMPLLHISVKYDDNDERMIRDFQDQFTDMFEKAGFVDIKVSDDHRAPGLDIHEMGGARMGNDPNTSILNRWHQVHSCKNIIVTDGACMTSTSTQNPSLTYMAMAARAANHAVDELEKGAIL